VTGGIQPTFTVLLVADPPPPTTRAGGEDPAGRYEALVAFGRAAFAAGGQVALPVDTGIAPLLATLALEYAPVGFRRVVVMETQRPDAWARCLLAPFVARGAVDILGLDGQPVDLGPRADGDGPEGVDAPRQPVRPELVEVSGARAAMLISPAPAALDDLDVLRRSGVRIAVLRNTAMTASRTRSVRSTIPAPASRRAVRRAGGRVATRTGPVRRCPTATSCSVSWRSGRPRNPMTDPAADSGRPLIAQVSCGIPELGHGC
jgi:hypothetical protein